MDDSDYHRVKYVDGHPVLHPSCSVKGKQKVSTALKLKHGRDFMEMSIAMDPTMLKTMPPFVGGVIPQIVRDDKAVQMKSYETLALITNKAIAFFSSILEETVVENANMLGVTMRQTDNPHYNTQNEIIATSVAIKTFPDLIMAIGSESFRKEASSTSYDSAKYFRMCYMLTDNFRDKKFVLSCYTLFATKWGGFRCHAVIDVMDPNEHDFRHSWNDSCDRIRERIINAQIRCLRRCFLSRVPTGNPNFIN